MDYSKLLRIFSDKLIEANEIYINEKLSQLGFDRTRRGKVISVSGTNCVVEIDGEEFNCKLRRGTYVEPNDIVFVKFPQDSNVDRYVDAILGGNETPENLVISAEEILDKLISIINSANTSKSNLDESISTANVIKTALDDSITEGYDLKSDLDAIISGTDYEQIILDLAKVKEDIDFQVSLAKPSKGKIWFELLS